MAKATTTKKTTTTRRRARTDEGKFIKDDPTTPDVNEAWVEETVEVKAEAPKKKAAPQKAKVEEAPVEVKPEPVAVEKFVMFESREKEPSMFYVAGIRPIRNFSTGRLEYKVPSEEVDRFVQNHFVTNARIIRKV